METAKLQVPWSGGHLGGRSSAEDCRGVVVAGAPEALMVGTAEDGRGVVGIPEALVARTTEGLRNKSPETKPAVKETPEAVNTGIPNGPTS